MKKIFLFLILTVVCLQPVSAKNVKVEALSDFSTENPPKHWELKVVSDITTKTGVIIPAGSLLDGEIVSVTSPKRLKRNANFKYVLTGYTNAVTGEYFKVNQPVIGKYSSLTDVSPIKVVEKGAITAGNHFVGAYLGPSVALVEGAVKNEEGNRAKSAALAVYDSTPLSYIKKGEELNIKTGDTFVINFKLDDNDENETDSDKEFGDK